MYGQAETYREDITLDEAARAHQGTSFYPDERGAGVVRRYAEGMASDYQKLLALAKTEEKRELLDTEWGRYRAAYREKVRRWLSAKSRCISTMITGGSNFPVRRAERANNAEHGRLNDMIDFRKRALASIEKKISPSSAGPIMSGDPQAAGKLLAEITKAEKLQEMMKKTNAVVRSTAQKSDDEKVSLLMDATGFSEMTARKLLVPNCFGRLGFSDFELKNNLANIKRLKGRLLKIESAHATPDKEEHHENGITVRDCPAENRIRIFFPGKPERNGIEALKRNGFRWTPSLGCWQSYRNDRSIEHANKLAKED